MLCVDKQQRVFEIYRAEPYRVVVHLPDYLKVVIFSYMVYACVSCFTPSMWKVRSDEEAKRQSAIKTTPCCPPSILFTCR